MENPTMKMTNSSWISSALKLLLVAALPHTQVSGYSILAIPFPARSHVFAMSTIAVDLADRGHKVTFLVGENSRPDVPELRNRPEIGIVQYGDTSNFVATEEKLIREVILESRGDDLEVIAGFSSRYASSSNLPNNTAVCTSTSVQFREAGQQGPTRTVTVALNIE